MFWRKRSSSKEKDYEKLLEDIDSEIKKVEDNLRQIKIREDRTVVTWLYYSIPLYSLVLIIYSFVLYKTEDPWPVLCIKASPLLIGLFLIIFIKKFISIWYKKQQMKEEAKNTELKKEQKEILEELKNKLKYYQTKNLIEKYELRDQPLFHMKNNNGMPMMYPQMQMNGQRMNPNQMKNPQLSKDKKQQLMAGHTISKQRSMPVVLKNGKQQFADMRFNQQYNQQQQPVSPSNPNERKWIDKLMDAIVGDVYEADSKYALVCNFCYTHCGLALPEEYKTYKFICPSCKKMNDNAKKYNVSNPNGNKKIDGNNQMSLPPPSAPVNKIGTFNNSIPINHTQSVPVTPQNPTPIIPDNNNAKPNLARRSSTLLEEMDDSSNTDLYQNNKISTEVSSQNEESTENIDQDENNLKKIEKEVEEEEEIINYQENNNVTNDENVNEGEIKNEVNDNDENQESLSTEDQQVEKDESITNENDLKKQN